jgi:outer membrane protein assembly factor BamB
MKRQRLLFLLFLLSTGCQSHPETLWSFKTGGYVYASPSVSQNMLLIGSTDSFLYALDLTSGKEIWKQKLDGPVHSKPLVYPEAVYVGGGKNLYQLDPKNGSIAWKFSSQDLIEYNPCGDAQSIFCGSNDGNFYKVSRDGKLLWNYDSKQKVWGNCEFYQDLVFTTSWDTYCYGLDRSTGALKWKVGSGQHNYGGPEVYKDRVYFASHHLLFAIDATSGKVLTTAKTGYLNFVVPFQDYLWTTENGLTKRTLDGKFIANVNFKASSTFRPVRGDQYLIIADTTDNLMGVSTQMKILWKYKADDAFWASGVIHDGVYYTGNRDACVYAFKLPQ